jgi:Outer membrane protein beta-barrel domain
MRCRVLCTLPLLLVALSSVPLHAQAKLAIYGTGGVENSDLQFSGWNTAGTFGFYAGLRHYGPVDISADVRGDLSSNIYSGILGPRLAVKLPIFPIMPYGEFLFGGSSYSTLSNGVRDASNFTYRGVVGVDFTLLPHFDWRVVDFSYSSGITQFNQSVHPKTVTTGFVVRF